MLFAVVTAVEPPEIVTNRPTGRTRMSEMRTFRKDGLGSPGAVVRV